MGAPIDDTVGKEDAFVERLLTKRDVAERLAIKPATVMNYRTEGKPFFSDKSLIQGRRVLWKESDLVAYIASLEYELA